MFLIFLPPGMLTLLDTKTSAWIAVIFTYMVSEWDWWRDEEKKKKEKKEKVKPVSSTQFI